MGCDSTVMEKVLQLKKSLKVLFRALQDVADEDCETAEANSSILNRKLVANQNFLVTISDQVVSFLKSCLEELEKIIFVKLLTSDNIYRTFVETSCH